MYSPSLLDNTVIPFTIYKSFESTYLSLSLIVTYYCVGFDCLNTKIEKHKYLLTYIELQKIGYRNVNISSTLQLKTIIF